MPVVTIIIPNYNGIAFLPECFTTVLTSTYTNFEIIIIDDGSTDESIAYINKVIQKDNRVKLIRQQHRGASASRNLGIKSARGKIVVFLDNDVKVHKDWLGELVSPILEPGSVVSATCSKTLLYQKPNTISTAGLLLIPHTGWGIALGSGDRDGDPRWEHPMEVVAISAALAVRKDVVLKIGGFDELLAVHTEDLDFCWRIWLSGHKILYTPSSKVYHWSKSQEEREKIMNASKSYVYFHINKNTIRTLIKNYSVGYLLYYLPIALIIIFGRGIVFCFTRSTSVALVAAVRAVLWNSLNLKDTLIARRHIQERRAVSDSYLYKKIMTHLPLLTIYRRHYSQ